MDPLAVQDDIINGKVARVEQWLLDGGDVNACIQSCPILGTAIVSGQEGVIELLLRRRADPDALYVLGTGPSKGSPMITLAVSWGCVGVVDLLLGAKALADKRHSDGSTALMTASTAGHMDIVESLLRAQANPNAVAEVTKVKGEVTLTPLMCAVFGPTSREEEVDEKLIRRLLLAKADPSYKYVSMGGATVGETILRVAGPAGTHIAQLLESHALQAQHAAEKMKSEARHLKSRASWNPSEDLSSSSMKENIPSWLSHIEPHWTRAHEQRAKCDAKGAIRSYQACIDLAPTFVGAHLAMGELWGQLGGDKLALRCFQTCVDLEPTCTMSLCNLGGALSNRGQFEEALTYFDRCLAIDPKHSLGKANRCIEPRATSLVFFRAARSFSC